MLCRQCGTEIADKALICFRCGTPTTEAKVAPPARSVRRRRIVPVLLVILILALAALFLRGLF
jgi:uncharacterized membrane protein YvbJ